MAYGNREQAFGLCIQASRAAGVMKIIVIPNRSPYLNVCLWGA
jgi:hypothetical protein